MNLISTLSAGVAAAPNGIAQIFLRGTSTRATVYYTFEGATPDSSGADIDLDSYGSVEVYVNALVDVVVKNADGTTVRTFTEGHSAPLVEVRSPSFTGIDYDTLAAAAGNPTNLKAILDLWETSADATDFNVNVNGVDKSLQDAFGSLAGLVYNVKDPSYGAVGDGVTDDQAAIQAALAAAVAAGGGIVFFPKGTYLTLTAIEWDHHVSAMGVGADLSIITTNSPSSARILTWTSGTAQEAPILIQGLSFESAQSNTGSQLYSTVAVNIIHQNCYFGSSTNSTGTLVSHTGASSYVRFLQCRFNLNGAANTSIALASTSRFHFSGCKFTVINTAWEGSVLTVTGRGSVYSSIIDISLLSGASPGVRYGIANSAAGDTLHVSGCQFQSNAQVFNGVLNLTAGSLVIATGNELELTTTSATSWYTVSGLLRLGSFLQSTGVQRSSGATTDTIRDGIHLYEMSSATTVPTMTMPTKLYPGQVLRVIFFNGSGVDWPSNIVFTGATLAGPPDTTAANGEYVFGEFVVSDLAAAGTYLWVATRLKIGA